jgi:hypothetical protein
MTQDTLAGRMFLILHDPFTGKPEVGLEPLKNSLVAASLAELMLQRRLGMQDDRVVVVDPRRNGSDEIGTFVVENVQRQRGAHPVKTWLEGLADVIYELIARGLVSDGIVRRERGRRLVKRASDHFPAVDLLRAAGPRVRLEHMLRVPRDLDMAGAALAGIVRALDAERVLDRDRDRAAVRSSVTAAAHHLPPELMGLVDGVQSAVAVVSYKYKRL